MKKLVFLLIGIFPMVLIGQNKCDLFEKVTFNVEDTELNTSESDFGPSVVMDELWFSAFTKDEIDKLSRGISKKVFYNLFHAGIDKDGNVNGAAVIDLEEVSEGYHAGPVSFCPETKELFVTLNNFDNPVIRNKVYRKADIGLKIVVLKQEGDSWSFAYELPFNNAAYSVGHPTVSKSGDKLFVTSNMPNNGKGGTDLYMAERKDGKWGELVNLGDKINTGKDEMFPFLYKENVLIFASNGMKEGKNDLDLYYSCISNGSFSEPKSFDQLNSDADDFAFVIHEGGEVGYFTSGRTGGVGNDDIYKVVLEGQYDLELTVLDKETMEPVPNPVVKFDDNISAVLDGSVFKRALKNKSTVTATSETEGYVFASKKINTTGKPYGTIKETLLVQKIEEDVVIELENIYYDFDKWNILPESEVELDRLVKFMNQYPEMEIELRSHTDSRGSHSYNDLLSQKRSDSAVGYIVKSGISKDRVTAKGYGENELVNKCADGVKCSEEEHRKNRRTEFKILKIK